MDDASPFTSAGLTSAEAAALRAKYGPNEFPSAPGRGLVQIVAGTLREPMFLLMLGAAALYGVLGDVAEGLFLLAAAIAALGLVIVQENRSERALAALRDLAQPQAHIIRDGQTRRLPASELVPGDIMLMSEGDRVPADALLVAGDVLRVDEAALTGESAPVSKRPALAAESLDEDAKPGAAIGPHLFAGTVVSAGQGVARVTRTGTRSALGRIGASLASIEIEATPLQKTAGRLVALLGFAALGFCAVVAMAYGLLRHDWVQGALAGITAAIALIPEEFPMIFAVFLALGAWRLAAHRVLVRRTAVIEALGAATVLCVDKTGTLTENHMRVARLWVAGKTCDVERGDAPAGEALDMLHLTGLATPVRPVDPMDRAIRERLGHVPAYPIPLSNEPVRSWPLSPARLAVIQAWAADGDRHVLAAKGAPETVAKLCRLSSAQTAKLMAGVEQFAEEGLRVLAVCACEIETLPPGDPGELRFELAGLVAFVDPLRADASPALEEARRAGVTVIMITGDHPATAMAVARAAGIDTTAGVLTGPEVEAMPLQALRERLRQIRVFARIAPEQKLLLVEALKENGEVVVMTGDGVNDAPALQAAHIGVAMGRRGADVAREAAALVLLDDSFASIVRGVSLGRRIFTNLRRALTYVTAIHVPIAGLALLPILFGLPPILFPMHVVLMELAIDPICALVFEGEPSEAGAMARPPRRADEPLFGPAQLAVAIGQGAILLAAIFGLYVWALSHVSQEQARGAAFVALVLGNLSLALVDGVSGSGGLFARHRRVYWLIAGGAVLLLSIVLVAPPVARMFEVARPSPDLLMLSVGVSIAASGWWGAVRLLRRFGSSATSAAL